MIKVDTVGKMVAAIKVVALGRGGGCSGKRDAVIKVIAVGMGVAVGNAMQ